MVVSLKTYVPEIRPARSEFKDLAQILTAALRAVDPVTNTYNIIQRVGEKILVKNEAFRAKHVHVVGFGKASAHMALGLEKALGTIIEGGVVIVPRGLKYPRLERVEVLEADHPIPTMRTVEASLKLLEYLEANVEENDLVFVLVSGGGSALFEVPANSISIEDIAYITRELLKRGASIEELNAVRKHLSRVKGGQLLHYIKSRVTITLIVSDVIGDRLDTIASGPTVPDETSYRDAYRVLVKYGVWDKAPETVKQWIKAGVEGQAPETPKPGNPIFDKNRVIIVANNYMALKAAAMEAQRLGYNTLIVSDRVRGEAREVAKTLAAIAESTSYNREPIGPPAAIIAGGETTVTVRGDGIGGRNQELCLALTLTIDPKVAYRAACLGTDGIDGISPAAGAYTSDKVLEEAREKGLEPVDYLERNDSYTFFKKLGLTIETGYTGTNVNDVYIILVHS